MNSEIIGIHIVIKSAIILNFCWGLDLMNFGIIEIYIVTKSARIPKIWWLDCIGLHSRKFWDFCNYKVSKNSRILLSGLDRIGFDEFWNSWVLWGLLVFI